MKAVPEKVNEPRKLVWLVDTLERLAPFPPVVPEGTRICLVPGADRTAERERQNVAGLWRDGLAGARGRSERHLSSRLCCAVRGRDLCSSRLPQEGEGRYRNSPARIGTDPAAASTRSEVGREMRRRKM